MLFRACEPVCAGCVQIPCRGGCGDRVAVMLALEGSVEWALLTRCVICGGTVVSE